jgi:hypothetical protein
MSGSIEQQSRDLFAADGATAPQGLNLVAGARRLVPRRRA